MNDIWRELLQARTDVTLAIGFVLAVVVTIHVLLTKREVASAVGWIGLVWFAPILGAIVYALLGINRVHRRARMLRQPDSGGDPNRPSSWGGDDLGPLARGIGRLTERPLVAGTAVQHYENGDAAYPPMLAAIAAAKVSVGISSYIFRDDQWGGRFIDALSAAAARGVQVRVLIDGIGGGWLSSRAYHRLRRNGVAAARFMHSALPWRMPFLNLRSHRKILVIDGVIGFTGGMNIADENVMATRPAAPVQDVHFRIDGPVVSQLSEAFADDWASVTNENLDGPAQIGCLNYFRTASVTNENLDGPAERRGGHRSHPASVTNENLDGPAWLPTISPRDGALARVVDSGPDADVEKIEFAVLEAVACAQSSIRVMTPYFLPDERLISALALAAMRGVTVDLVIPAKSNHRLVDWATRANIGPLLTNGVRIWLSRPPFHHTKLMVVDESWCLIGSCNWDIRSFRLNFELCMEVYDGDLAATLIRHMEASRQGQLTQADIDARSLPMRIRDAAARLLLPYL